ncbi:hypothetical protein CIB95_05390 [Lottiidibacillus patelloidae]|uniref:KTSC domain-containing protein n=1 Tax=Lottiidibacillus patelloidae TaxID=2670334 RepID=A0A263BVQ0_9BACI|nr:KTSC domain-containing protein [Lottiidibacillus patelloidae]OZM57799.1 hypothetical protein CIB95_05390 [Lottiidibacillus patelloidae]
MKFTTFNRVLWNLKQFDTIGYDKTTKTLIVKFFSGEEKKFTNISEETIFEFIIAPQKEQFFYDKINSKVLN